MGELIAGFFEMIFEILVQNRKTRPFGLALIVITVISVGLYCFYKG